MRTPIHPRFIPPPYQDAADSGRLILRDGSTAGIRPGRELARRAALRVLALIRGEGTPRA
jgi:hypothetical protein